MKAVFVGLFILCGAYADKTPQLGLNGKNQNETEPWICKTFTNFAGLNEKCRNETESWICKTFSSCSGSKQGLKLEETKKISSGGKDPIACCPPVPPKPEIISNSSKFTPDSGGTIIGDIAGSSGSSPTPGVKAEEKCREYAKYVYRVMEKPILLPGSDKTKTDECPITAQTLIVGGSPAKLKEFPHMAMIGVEDQGDTRWFCGGSLISPWFVLSAAHCNISQYIGKAVTRLGELVLNSDSDGAKPIDVKIVEVFDHPKYDHSRAYHDISLFKLERKVPLGPSIRPLCLKTMKSINYEEAIASGWGRIAQDNRTSDQLLKVGLPIVNIKRCTIAYRFEHAMLPERIIPDIMFCAGGEQEKDTCMGDSGGPLQIAVKEPYCMYLQVGITSFGTGCGSNTPGVYTRISYYVPWIESIVWPDH